MGSDISNKGANFYLQVFLVTAAIIAVVGGYYYFEWKSAGEFASSIDHSDILFEDFVRHFYPMGKDFSEAKVSVTGYYYSALFTLFLKGFGALSESAAMIAWVVLQVVTGVLLFLGGANYFLKKSQYHYYVYVLVFCISFPLLYNFRWGQVVVLVAACVFGAIYLYRKKQIVLAAIVLAAGGSIKLYTLIFLIYFLMKKEFRLVVYCVLITGIFIWAIPTFTINFGENFGFYEFVSKNMRQVRPLTANNSNLQDFSTVMMRLDKAYLHMSLPRWSFTVVSIVIIFVNMFFIWRIITMEFEDEIYRAFVILFLTVPFLVPMSWPHYFVYLPFCQAAVMGAVWGQRNFVLFLINAILLVVSLVFSSAVFFNLVGDWMVYSFGGYLFFSNFVLLPIVYSRGFSGNIERMPYSVFLDKIEETRGRFRKRQEEWRKIEEESIGEK